MKPRPKVTLASIAQEAGISTGAASRILNNRMAHQFSLETRKSVLKIAERTSYSRNLAARGMAHRHSSACTRTMTVMNSGPFGWDMRDPANFFTQTINGVMREAKRQDFMINLAGELTTAREQIAVLERITNGQTDGVLSCGLILRDALQYILDHKIPGVHIGDGIIPTGLARVCGDNVNGGLLAARHLISLGHRKMAFVGDVGDSVCQFYSQRLAGFTLGLQEAGLSVDKSLVMVRSSQNLTGELEGVMSLRHPPTAFFGGVQDHAMKVLEWLQQRGRAVPQQVSVIGYDNFPNSETTNPTLTVIDVPRETIGATAVRLLIHSIQHPDAPPVTTLVPVSLVLRESTGLCAAK